MKSHYSHKVGNASAGSPNAGSGKTKKLLKKNYFPIYVGSHELLEFRGIPIKQDLPPINQSLKNAWTRIMQPTKAPYNVEILRYLMLRTLDKLLFQGYMFALRRRENRVRCANALRVSLHTYPAVRSPFCRDLSLPTGSKVNSTFKKTLQHFGVLEYFLDDACFSGHACQTLLEFVASIVSPRRKQKSGCAVPQMKRVETAIHNSCRKLVNDVAQDIDTDSLINQATSSFAESLKEAAPDIGTKMAGAIKKELVPDINVETFSSGVSAAIKSILNKLYNLVSSVTNCVIEDLKNTPTWVVLLLCLGAISTIYNVAQSLKQAIAPYFLALCTWFGFDHEGTVPAWCEEPCAEAQSFQDVVMYASLAVSLVLGKQVNMRALSDMLRMKHYGGSMVDALFDNFTYCMHYLAYEFTGDERFKYVDQLAEIKEVINDCGRIFLRRDVERQIVKDKGLGKDVSRIHRKMHELVPVVNVMKERGIATSFRSYQVKIANLYTMSLASSSIYNNRVEPVCIMLAGPPNQGKTTVARMITDLTYEFMHRSCPETFPQSLDEANLIYTKPQTSQYWEKYAGHFCTVMDEFYQSRNPDALGSACVDLTQMISSGPFTLDSAAISGKGTNMFSSSMVTIMSNMTTQQFSAMQLSDPRALYRRFHFPLTVVRKKELPPTGATTQEMLEAWEFRLTEHARKNFDLYTGVPSGLRPDGTYNILEITKVVCTEMLRRHKSDPISSWTSNEGNRSEFLELMADAQMFRWYRNTTSDDEEVVHKRKRLNDDPDGKGKRKQTSDSDSESETEIEVIGEPDPNQSVWDSMRDLNASMVQLLMNFRFSNQVLSVEAAERLAKNFVEHFESLPQLSKFEANVRIRCFILHWMRIASRNDTYTEMMYRKFLISGDWKWITETVYLQHSVLSVFRKHGLVDIILSYEQMDDIPDVTIFIDKVACDVRRELFACNTFLRVREDSTRMGLIAQLTDWGYVSKSLLKEAQEETDLVRRSLSVPYEFSFFERVTLFYMGVWDTFVKVLCRPFGYWTTEGYDGVDPIPYVKMASLLTAFYVGYRTTRFVQDKIIVGCQKLAKWFVSEEEDPEAQTKYERNPRYIAGMTRRTNRTLRTHYMRSAAHAQAGAKTVNIGQKIAKNVFDVTFHCSSHSQVGKIFFVCDTYAVCAGHAVTVLGRPLSITLQFGKEGGNVQLGNHQYEIRHIPERDLAIIKFCKKAVQPKTKLTNYLLSRNDFDDLQKDKCVRVHSWSNQGRAVSFQNCGQVTAIDTPFRSSTVIDGRVEYIPYDHYYTVYEGRANKGDCGLPYISDGECHLLGIHIASYNRDGIVAPIFKEDFDEKVLANAQTLVIPNYLPRPDLPPKRIREGTIPLGTLDKGVGAPSRNDLEPTILNARGVKGTAGYSPPIYEVNVEPARVSYEDGYDPWVKANSDYVKTSTPPMPPLMQSLLKVNPDTLWAGFAHEHEPTRVCKRLSLEVAIFGDDEIGIGSMKSGSSPGLYGLYNGLKRKDYFNLDDKTIDPNFCKRVEELSRIARSGDIPFIDCLENLKVELRTTGKYPRMFSAVGAEHVTWTKMVLGDLISYLKKHHLTCASAIGINPHCPEWDLLGRRVLKKGYARIGGDFSGCDVTVPHYAWYIMFKFANSYYCYEKGTEDYLELKACCRSVTCMYRVRGNEVFMLQRGHPSGHYLTSVWNSLWGYVMYRYIFLKLYPDASLGEWYNAVNMVVYGDDNIGCVFAERFPEFNMINIARMIREEFGMIYTMPDKSEIVEPYLVSEEDPDFLSRGFIQINQIYRAPLKLDSIYGMLLYTHKSDELSAEEQLRTNLNAAEMELFQHGKEAYEHHTRHISRECTKRGLNYIPKKYSYWLGWYASSGDNNRVKGYPEKEAF